MQVARNLGKTLREFQPTIREIQVGAKYSRVQSLLNLLCKCDSIDPFDLTTCHFCSFRMFQGNLRAHLNGRLVLMTFQTHYRTHTLPMYETPRQLHLPLKLPIILRPLLTLVSYLVYILFYFILSYFI
jgi:hypothetical protein